MILISFDFCGWSGLIFVGFDFLSFIVWSSCLSLGVAWDYGIQTIIGLKLCILWHNYENLCSCLHKYLLTYLFSMYSYYAMTILLPWILHTYKLCQNLWKLNFQFFSQVYFIKISTLIKVFLSNEGVFKIPNTHIYINEDFLKSYTKPCDSTCTLICNIIFLTIHHF